MYTIVMMAAMTSGSASPAWHRSGGCHGCYGVTSGCAGSCYGCFGCYGSGYSSSGGPAYGGSCLGTSGAYSVYGPNPIYGCWGCWGSNWASTVYSGPAAYGYGAPTGHGLGTMPGWGLSFQCHGCYGCYGGWSCYGSPTTPPNYAVGESGYSPMITPGTSVPPVVPSTPPPPPANPKSDLPKKEGDQSRVRSKVIIEVPEGAKLFVDDNLMKPGAGQRVFQTPPLNVGETYYYEVRVEVTREGKTSSDTQRLVIRPGETVTASFMDPGRPDVVTVRNETRD